MSYIFDVSEEHNDLLDMDYHLRYKFHGDYKGNNRRDEKGHLIYNVELTDKRFALQFKLMFNVTVVKWDESDDEEIVTEQDLIDRGYVEMKFNVSTDRAQEFRAWCKARDYPIVDELKFLRNNQEPMTLWVPESEQVLVKLTWAAT